MMRNDGPERQGHGFREELECGYDVGLSRAVPSYQEGRIVELDLVGSNAAESFEAELADDRVHLRDCIRLGTPPSDPARLAP